MPARTIQDSRRLAFPLSGRPAQSQAPSTCSALHRLALWPTRGPFLYRNRGSAPVQALQHPTSIFDIPPKKSPVTFWVVDLGGHLPFALSTTISDPFDILRHRLSSPRRDRRPEPQPCRGFTPKSTRTCPEAIGITIASTSVSDHLPGCSPEGMASVVPAWPRYFEQDYKT